ncbi:unnamed protein product [Symbiodinium natans]|uniref:Glycoside hydrolase family 5 domain-containing protein n=1 Tax=Symbiodinium natans TaxID=878477 RepID=A0A812MSX5_9DINO|nr:unnamed protein product [Symbiodinium natans]
MRGINLPATQGTSNAGNFLPGVYPFDYSAADLDKARQKGFDALRLPVNVSTADAPAALGSIRAYFDSFGGQGLLCFFEESSDPQAAPHGSGCADVAAASATWMKAHAAFSDTGVLYEIFNEPFGYKMAEEYLHNMLLILHYAQLPVGRCVLDGFGYADDVQVLHRLGWQGYLAYHFYPNWLPEGQRTEQDYARKVSQDLAGIQDRTLITEFGAGLDLSDDQKAGREPSEDAQCLRGLAAAVRQLPSLQGAFHWHGWDNGDSYDFWGPGNQLGADLVLAVLDGCGTSKPRPSTTAAEPLALFRKEEMTYLLLLSDRRFPQMPDWGWTFERIACYCWPEADASLAETVPVQCWRKGELACYCLADSGPDPPGPGFTKECLAFRALPAACDLPNTAVVHEWRKEELTYYSREDWEGYGRLPSWGWTYHGAVFRVPAA